MSLLTEAMETVHILDKVTTSDGYGGYTTAWTQGAEIQAAIVLDTSIQALQAQKMGVTGVYTITTRKDITLAYHDVIQRADGQVLRVTDRDKATPPSAGLNMRQVRAEEWTLDGQVASTT